MTDIRKTIDQLKTEHDEDRKMYGRVFHHKRSKENYQLIFCAFSECGNIKQAVYVLCSMPWLKFVRPFDEFKDSFEEGPYQGDPENE